MKKILICLLLLPVAMQCMGNPEIEPTLNIAQLSPQILYDGYKAITNLQVKIIRNNRKNKASSSIRVYFEQSKAIQAVLKPQEKNAFKALFEELYNPKVADKKKVGKKLLDALNNKLKEIDPIVRPLIANGTLRNGTNKYLTTSDKSADNLNRSSLNTKKDVLDDTSERKTFDPEEELPLNDLEKPSIVHMIWHFLTHNKLKIGGALAALGLLAYIIKKGASSKK